MDNKCLNNKLKQYKAKSDNTTIYQHNIDLENILNQLHCIHNISDKQYYSLQKSIVYHDIGKIIDDFQKNIQSTHRKLRHEILSASYNDLTETERLSILLHHKQLKDLLKYIDNIYYPQFITEVKDKLNINTINIIEYFKSIARTSRKNAKLLSNKELLLQCGYLKLCDHIASAGITHIDIGFNSIKTYNFDTYKSVQEKILKLQIPQDVIIQAPTGVGKTETSLFWSDLVQNQNKSKRIFYILPYTASINALYKRLKNKNISVGVLHSKVKSLLNKDDSIDNIQEELQFFKKNIKQITICTLFQLVKAMFGCKNFEMILAQLKESIIIVDEIHCFDIHDFTLLIETLKYLKDNYDIDICIMSASIPTSMLNIIQEKLHINTIIKSDKEDYLIRHKIKRKNKLIIDDLDNINMEVRNNKKVLICVNNVNIAQTLYTYFNNKYINKKIKLIHGRYNAKDRTIIEENIDNCDILIGTQAIEVSLDIDFDIMYTEIAPLDALIQRFGRVNRKGKKGISDIYIYNQSNNKIYDREIINLTDSQLKDIINRDKGVIYDNKINCYLDNVYPQFNNVEYNTYELIFKQIIQGLQAGNYNPNVNEQIMGNNNSTMMLPSCLLNEYNTYIDNKQYIEAQELLVNTRIRKEEYFYDDKLNIYINNYLYDERGLIYADNIENRFF